MGTEGVTVESPPSGPVEKIFKWWAKVFEIFLGGELTLHATMLHGGLERIYYAINKEIAILILFTYF